MFPPLLSVVLAAASAGPLLQTERHESTGDLAWQEFLADGGQEHQDQATSHTATISPTTEYQPTDSHEASSSTPKSHVSFGPDGEMLLEEGDVDPVKGEDDPVEVDPVDGDIDLVNSTASGLLQTHFQTQYGGHEAGAFLPRSLLEEMSHHQANAGNKHGTQFYCFVDLLLH